jgi:hypothetical protein
MSERKLTTKQIETLLITYRFRFITTNNLARHKQITHNSAYSALEILAKNGYLGRKHNKSYRLQNKPASYYLKPQAVTYLSKSDLDVNKDVLKSRFREHTKSAEFIDQQIAIHEAYLDLLQQMGDSAEILIGAEMTSIEGMIKPAPSLFVKPTKGRIYFIELTDGQHLFIVKKRIRKYIENYEADEWEWDEYPDVYILRNSKADRNKLEAYIEECMDDAYLDEEDLQFMVMGAIR